MATMLASMGAQFAASCCASLACQGMSCAGGAVARSSARLAYSILFFLSLVLSWVLRDAAKPLLMKLPWVVRKGMGELPDSWFGEQAVYRVSLGNFAFFGLLSLVLIGVKTNADPRHKHIQNGIWPLKFFVWLVCNILPFFASNGFIAGYAWLARVLSGFFLIIQLLLLLDFAYEWSDSWVAKEDSRWLAALLAATVACFGGGLALIGVSYAYFKPPGAGDCDLNVFLITSTLLLGLGYALLPLHPAVPHGSLLCSAVVFLYCAYMTFSALSSEPHGYACNGRAASQAAAGKAATAGGMALTLLSVAYSAFRAGSSDVLMQRERGDAGGDASGGGGGGEAYRELAEAAGSDVGSEAEEEGAARRAGRAVRDVPYNYTFFHMVFALASAYTAMLMTDWGSGAGASRDQIGVGWASVWLKMASQWATILLYIWSLIAPAVFPDRDFS